MRRRELLKATGASLTALAAPRIGRAERPNKLVFVPVFDLSVLDPVVVRRWQFSFRTPFRSPRGLAYPNRWWSLAADRPISVRLRCWCSL
jgi:hypothetical protein